MFTTMVLYVKYVVLTATPRKFRGSEDAFVIDLGAVLVVILVVIVVVIAAVVSILVVVVVRFLTIRCTDIVFYRTH
jgi:hypothetical protein